MAKQILKDITKNEKERPWQERKLENVTYSDYLRVLHFKKAHNVSTCGNVLRVVADDEGRLKLAQTWFCHSRLCPLCNWRRAMKNSNQLVQILQETLNRRPTGQFLFLTLTERNATGSELRSELRKMGLAVSKLFRYKKIAKNLLGYVRSTEITVNEEGPELTYHQHMHVLLFVSPTYFKDSPNYVNEVEWRKFWRRAMKLDYDPMVNVKRVRPNVKKGKSALLASADETAKYQVKSTDMLTGHKERDLQVVDDLEQGLAGTRQISYGGLLKTVRKDLQLEDADSGDLIDTDNPDEEIGDAVREVVAEWDSLAGNYFVKEE